MGLSLIESACQVSVTWMLVIITCVLCYYAHRKSVSERSKNLPPGSMGWPIIGETISLAIKKVNFFRDRRQKYGAVYKTHLLMHPNIRVSGAAYVQTILKGENKIVVAASPKSVRTIFGKTALTQIQGIDHVHQKRDFVQSLVGHNLSSYLKYVSGIIENATSDWTSSKDVGLLSSVGKLSLGAILSILYGNSFSTNDVDALSKPAGIVVDNLFCLPINLPGTNYNKVLEARSELLGFVKMFMAKLLGSGDIGCFTPLLTSILGGDVNNNRQQDFLNNTQLMKKLTDCSIELIVAGRSATYSSIVNSILMLKKHPDVLERLRKELAEHSLENPKTCALPEVTLEQLKSLNYLDQVVKEIMRLFPPVGGNFRVTTQPFKLGGYDIPENWYLTYSIRDTHEFQEIPNCGQFDPDRWDYDNAWRPDRERFAYIPFGAGVRSCPGKEFAKMFIKLTLVQLCRSCDWSLLEDYEMSYYPVIVPAKDVRIRFIERQLSYMH